MILYCVYGLGLLLLLWAAYRGYKMLPEFPQDAPKRRSKEDADLKRCERALAKGKCPDCGSTRILGGPEGGLCKNFMCGDCGEGWNLCMGMGVIGRIGNQKQWIDREYAKKAQDP